MPIPRIRGPQIGLRDPALVEGLKGQLLSGTFDFEELSHRIGGVQDHSGTYHVIDGHHRMVAALELDRVLNPTEFRWALLAFNVMGSRLREWRCPPSTCVPEK